MARLFSSIFLTKPYAVPNQLQQSKKSLISNYVERIDLEMLFHLKRWY